MKQIINPVPALTGRLSRIALVCVLTCSTVIFGGCARQADKKKAVSLLFGSFQRLAEADSMQAEGTIDLSGIDLPFHLAYQNKPEISIALESSSNGEPVCFYVKDGRTFLNFLGTKSSSLLENLNSGNQSSSSLNPFLDLSQEERMDLVDSVTVENETYTYTLNKEALSRVFDSYGTFSASYARLEASFNGEDLKDLDLSVKGTAALDAQSAPISLAVSLEIESMNQDVSISYPADLESWPVQ